MVQPGNTFELTLTFWIESYHNHAHDRKSNTSTHQVDRQFQFASHLKQQNIVASKMSRGHIKQNVRVFEAQV